MTPTLEEYDSLLDCSKLDLVYFYMLRKQALSNYIWLIKVDCKTMNKQMTKQPIRVCFGTHWNLYSKRNCIMKKMKLI